MGGLVAVCGAIQTKARAVPGRAIHRIVGLAWRRSYQYVETREELAVVARETFARLTSPPLAS